MGGAGKTVWLVRHYGIPIVKSGVGGGGGGRQKVDTIQKYKYLFLSGYKNNIIFNRCHLVQISGLYSVNVCCN
jgi:hypothetical protein